MVRGFLKYMKRRRIMYDYNSKGKYDHFLVSYDDGNIMPDFEGKNKDGIVYFLTKHGFKNKRGFYAYCYWYFIDIVNKAYYPSRPGVRYTNIVGEHAITFEEFKCIFFIYEKYKGLLPLDMGDGKWK